MTTAALIQLITVLALNQGINPETALAIAKIESNFKVNAIGPMKEVGLFQIHKSSTTYTKEQLLNPRINISEGLRILKQAKEKCTHQEDKTYVVCYNVGLAGGKKIKHPTKFPYYKRFIEAKAQLKKQKVYAAN